MPFSLEAVTPTQAIEFVLRVIFKSLVKKMKVISNREIEIEFECGIKVKESL